MYQFMQIFYCINYHLIRHARTEHLPKFLSHFCTKAWKHNFGDHSVHHFRDDLQSLLWTHLWIHLQSAIYAMISEIATSDMNSEIISKIISEIALPSCHTFESGSGTFQLHITASLFSPMDHCSKCLPQIFIGSTDLASCIPLKIFNKEHLG